MLIPDSELANCGLCNVMPLPSHFTVRLNLGSKRGIRCQHKYGSGYDETAYYVCCPMYANIDAADTYDESKRKEQSGYQRRTELAKAE